MTSIEDLDRAFEEQYEGESTSALTAVLFAIQGQVPVQAYAIPHQQKLESGDFEVIGTTRKGEDGSTSMSLTDELSRSSRPFLDRYHGLPDGRMVRTTLEYTDILGYEDTVAEAVWLWSRLNEK